MTEIPASVGLWCQSSWMLIPIVSAAVIIGRLLSATVAHLSGEWPVSQRRFPVVELAAALIAVAMWWWEIHRLAQLPAGALGAASATVCLRLAAHIVLFAFLAAASWIDLRHRVIPDAITVPGVLAGLAWNASFPGTLLPVSRAVERSFATPVIEADVLGAFGPLAGVGIPAWLAGAGGLAVMGLLFAIWWWFGTPPADLADDPTGRLLWLRRLVAVGGGVGLVVAWRVGGEHWAGLVTALVGLAVSAGMIWATRVGASRALRREAMGFGDVTLMAMAGAWLGWQACLLACVLAVLIGLAHGLLQLFRHAESELPFGPSLCLGLVVVVLAWRPLWLAAAPQFERPLDMALVVVLVIGLTAATLAVWARLRRSG